MFNTITFGSKEYLGRWITVNDELILAVDLSLKYAINKTSSKQNTTFRKYLDMNIVQFVPGNLLIESEQKILRYIAENSSVKKFA
jgi:hypothetical protein